MDNSSLDLSKIISLIMENPKLISDIKALAESNNENQIKEEYETESKNETLYSTERNNSPETQTMLNVAESNSRSAEQNNRKRLLTAFKPYLSGERSTAIDSMISIADIIDAMKAR